MSGAVHVVAVRSTVLSRAINGLPGGNAGVLVVPVPPERQVRMRVLAKAVLMALGKRFDVPGASGFDAALDADMQAWVGVRGITDLVVTEVERLPMAVAGELLDLMRPLGVRLWLVEYEPVRHRLDPLLNAASAVEMDLAAFEAHWLGRRPTLRAVNEDPVAHLRMFPPVPCTHGVAFRADCRRLLRAPDFAIVDALYRDAFRSTESRLANVTRQQHPQRLAALFRSEFRRIPCPDALVTVARAMQAAGFLSRWNVIVDELRLRSAAVRVARHATRPPTEWLKLDAYRRTDVPAVCTLLTSGLGPQNVLDATVASVGPDAAVVEIVSDNGAMTSLSVDRDGRSFLAAHVLRRRLGGASDEDLLFAGVGARRTSAQMICSKITKKAAVEVGFDAIRRLDATAVPDHVVKEVARLGLTFKSLRPRAAKNPEAAEANG